MRSPAGEAGTLARFVATGVAAALLLAGVLYALNAWAGWPPFLASGGAFLVAFAFSYTTQRGWTFGGRHSHAHAFPRYLAAQAACLLLSCVLAQALGGHAGATPRATAIGTTVVVSAASFALSRFWVFAG